MRNVLTNIGIDLAWAVGIAVFVLATIGARATRLQPKGPPATVDAATVERMKQLVHDHVRETLETEIRRLGPNASPDDLRAQRDSLAFFVHERAGLSLD